MGSEHKVQYGDRRTRLGPTGDLSYNYKFVPHIPRGTCRDLHPVAEKSHVT